MQCGTDQRDRYPPSPGARTLIPGSSLDGWRSGRSCYPAQTELVRASIGAATYCERSSATSYRAYSKTAGSDEPEVIGIETRHVDIVQRNRVARVVGNDDVGADLNHRRPNRG